MLRRHHHYHLLSSLTQRSFHCFQKTGGSTCQSDGRLGSDYCTGRAPGWICFHIQTAETLNPSLEHEVRF